MNGVDPAPHRPADNPFASYRVDKLSFRRRGLTLSDLDRRLVELGGRAAVAGPKGSGKTTLVAMLRTRVDGPAITVSIPASCRRPWRAVRSQLPRNVTQEHHVWVDGAEQLGPLGWRRLLRATRRARVLIVTLHEPGRLPTLVECRTDPELLRALVAELAPAHAHTLEPRLDELFNRHDGNIRECFRELYDLFAGRKRGASFEF